MNLNVFPPVFRQQLESQKQQNFQSENQRKVSAASQLNQSKGSSPESFNYVFGVGCVGFVIGFFVCVGNCDHDGFGETLGAWILCTIVGLAIGGGIYAAAKSAYESNISNIDNQISRNNQTSENRINDFNRECDRKYTEYISAFEKEAQNQSVRLAESELAKEVIAWMTEGFCRTIDSADRRPHVEQVNVPFIFNIFKHQITCNLGTFDFELKRCRDLRDPIEQTALARAIASTIQLNLVMKYPKDASRTDISININYSYTDDCVTANITYIAPNGNYQRVKEW